MGPPAPHRPNRPVAPAGDRRSRLSKHRSGQLARDARPSVSQGLARSVRRRHAAMSGTHIDRAAKPWLSIIVPCLNEAAAIAAMLEGLTPLRANGAEVIV